MRLIDRIETKRNDLHTTALNQNKEFFDFIDETMRIHGDEICKSIGENIVEKFNKYPCADRIEIRCFEPIYASEYPLGEGYPKYVGSLYCANILSGDSEISNYGCRFNFRDDILRELCMYQDDLKHTNCIYKSFCGIGVANESSYEGKYISVNDRSVFCKEQSKDLNINDKSYYTETLIEYKMFQIFNDYVIPYLEKEGFVIKREMHAEFSERGFVYEFKTNLSGAFGLSSDYVANQFIYIMLK